MARYVAQPCVGMGGYDVAEIDADGVGERRFSVSASDYRDIRKAEEAARFLILGLSMPGGLTRAIEALRAEHVRQENE